MAGLRCDGIIAPCVFDRPTNAVRFLAWVSKFLVPTVRRGDVVVMDNLSSHKAAAVRRAIRRGAADFSAALQPRPEPDRAGILEAQDTSAPRKCTHPGADRGLHRHAIGPHHTRTMRQLIPGRRLFNLKQSRSNVKLGGRARSPRNERQPIADRRRRLLRIARKHKGILSICGGSDALVFPDSTNSRR